MKLRVKLSNLHVAVGRQLGLRLELLRSLINLRQLLAKLTHLLLNKLLHPYDHPRLLIAVVLNQLLLLRHINSVVRLNKVVI